MKHKFGEAQIHLESYSRIRQRLKNCPVVGVLYTRILKEEACVGRQRQTRVCATVTFSGAAGISFPYSPARSLYSHRAAIARNNGAVEESLP